MPPPRRAAEIHAESPMATARQGRVEEYRWRAATFAGAAYFKVVEYRHLDVSSVAFYRRSLFEPCHIITRLARAIARHARR